MGRTVIEKILHKHTQSKDFKPGDIIWMNIDLRTARDFAGANVVKNYYKYFDDTPVADKNKTYFTFDCNIPAKTIGYANNQQICRQFAKKQGIKVYDVNGGIGSHIMIEQALCVPGEIVVGTDSHLNILGSMGIFGQGMGDVDIAFAFKTGKTWFEVPDTILIELEGTPSPYATPKDLILAVLRELGTKGCLGKAVEFIGKCLNSLTFDGRITFASMVTEMGGIIGFLPLQDYVIDYFKNKTNKNFTYPEPDKDAHYIEHIKINVDGLKPLVACPPNPANVTEVEQLRGKKITTIFIGSCTNGRFEDMKIVADIVKGKKIASDVIASIVPATREVYSQMLKEGLLQTLFDAGFIISNPGCGGCASGQIGMTGKGEVQISTSNRNFPGKQGDGEIYLASPATAAFSALKGYFEPYYEKEIYKWS